MRFPFKEINFVLKSSRFTSVEFFNPAKLMFPTSYTRAWYFEKLTPRGPAEEVTLSASQLARDESRAP
ncbi:hypothetical protein PoB_006078100 [Plakobranchus ocellatus]|uniref:Uncharacterized protein n=1 Tax=Plakobranchus ocellatus TaxID=259542 RepID=A0AAV4CR54_9GAST|nr:hypothetical protein PoB_006078100 [Plakobranchus ocellatus]